VALYAAVSLQACTGHMPLCIRGSTHTYIFGTMCPHLETDTDQAREGYLDHVTVIYAQSQLRGRPASSMVYLDEYVHCHYVPSVLPYVVTLGLI
jgi:hypothetical protein